VRLGINEWTCIVYPADCCGRKEQRVLRGGGRERRVAVGVRVYVGGVDFRRALGR